MNRIKKHAPRTTLTARMVDTMKPGEWASTSLGGRGTGTLEARALRSGAIAFYFRTTSEIGQRVRVAIGTGIRFDDAKKQAAELSLRYQRGDRDLRKALEIEQRERERERKATEAAARAAQETDIANRTRTLGALLTAYADQLTRDGKASARSVRAELAHHVREAWPKLWATPIDTLTTDDLLAIVALPVERGHKRQAEKVRAYLRAAFAAGMKARHNAAALPALRDLRITANPARDLTPIAGANRSRDRALSLSELRAYWHRIRKEPDHATLRFHLLTGCQRVQQLARAKLTDFNADSQTLRLLDGKGRRSEPRQHHVPIIPAALDAMHTMHGGLAGPHLFTLTSGASGTDYSGLFKRVGAIVDAMLAADELPGGRFTVGDLRRTVETRLADAGVSIETRARLQSHGLGGVQARHYNMHDYLAETRAALETLHRLLTGSGAKVLPMRRSKA